MEKQWNWQGRNQLIISYGTWKLKVLDVLKKMTSIFSISPNILYYALMEIVHCGM